MCGCWKVVNWTWGAVQSKKCPLRGMQIFLLFFDVHRTLIFYRGFDVLVYFFGVPHPTSNSRPSIAQAPLLKQWSVPCKTIFIRELDLHGYRTPSTFKCKGVPIYNVNPTTRLLYTRRISYFPLKF